jgi:eukaryotic-like serine/threonine-protein kinase
MHPSSEPPDPLLNACPSCEQLVDVSDLEPFEKIQCPHCEGAMRVRAIFDHFQLVEQIGQGGMSRVFRATDTLLNRDVALKILSHEFGSDSERIVQFEREARITASISHPNVVKVFSVGQDQGYFYIAMELVSYSSFEDVITRRGRVSEGEVLNIGLAVTQGLLAAHGAGLIHRDIKPGNILFADDGTAKLVDFGLALVVERDVDTSSEIWATPYYVAPEKLSGGPEDFRSDLYSLGATLFHALAGVPPVEVSTTSIEKLRELKAVSVDLSAVAPGITRPTAEVINRMLAHRPADRFDSYDQLTKALQAAKQGKGMITGRRRRSAVSSRSRKMLIAGLVTVTVGGALFLLKQMQAPGSGEGHGVGDLILDGTSSGAGSSASKFLKARQHLLDGNYPEAANLFSQVAASGGSQQPTINWALLNLGVSQFLQFDQPAAVAAFEKMVGNGVYSDKSEDLELVSFFLDLGKQVQSREPIRAEQRRVFAKPGYRCVGLLPLGLRRWEQGDVAGGVELLKDFQTAAVSSGVDWVTAYGKIVDPYLKDAQLLAALPSEPEPDSAEERAVLAALVTAGEMAQREFGVKGGAHIDHLGAQLGRAKQRLREIESASAKVSATIASEQLEKDRAAIRDELQKLVPARDELRLEACAEKLLALDLDLDLESVSGARERDAWAEIFRDADKYLTMLGTLQWPGDYPGPVIPRNAAPVYGVSYALVNGAINVQRRGGAEATVTFQDCSPGFLVALGSAALEGIGDSDRYLEVATGMVSLARIFELHPTVASYVDLVAEAAAVQDVPGAEWLRILGDQDSIADLR